MEAKYSFGTRKTIGVLEGLIFALWLTAAYNFAQILFETLNAAKASGTHTTPDGFEVTVCYFGPPVGFYPRFIVFLALLIACVGVLKRCVRGRIVSLLGLAGALSAYIYWWVASYKAFKSFSSLDIDFLNNPEISQVAYLYRGNWLDVCVAVSLLTALILQAEKVFTRRTRLL